MAHAKNNDQSSSLSEDNPSFLLLQSGLCTRRYLYLDIYLLHSSGKNMTFFRSTACLQMCRRHTKRLHSVSWSTSNPRHRGAHDRCCDWSESDHIGFRAQTPT